MYFRARLHECFVLRHFVRVVLNVMHLRKATVQRLWRVGGSKSIAPSLMGEGAPDSRWHFRRSSGIRETGLGGKGGKFCGRYAASQERGSTRPTQKGCKCMPLPYGKLSPKKIHLYHLSAAASANRPRRSDLGGKGGKLGRWAASLRRCGASPTQKRVPLPNERFPEKNPPSPPQ